MKNVFLQSDNMRQEVKIVIQYSQCVHSALFNTFTNLANALNLSPNSFYLELLALH